MRALLLIPLLLLLTACPRPMPEGTADPASDSLDPSLARALTLPPGEGTGPALARLKQAADQGSCAAAWLRARYLLDLYDAARLQPMMIDQDGKAFATAHLQLWSALDLSGAAGRGTTATRQVQGRMEALFAGIPASCPEAPRAGMAAKLLTADGAPRRTLEQSRTAAVAYKGIARSGAQVAPNAALRLAHWCAAAIRMAAGGEPALQHLRLNQCLFPLFDADPAPYFMSDPEQRPPAPPWTVLADQLGRMLKGLTPGRLAPLGAAMERAAAALTRDARPALPLSLSLKATPPPASQVGKAWDRTPLALYTGKGYLVGGQAILADMDGMEEELRDAIARRLKEDRRGVVTLVAPGSAPAEVALIVGRAARLAGARVLELGVSRQVAPATVEGDVQSLVFGRGPVNRLHGLPLSLLPLAARRAPAHSRDRPRGLEYDPRTAPAHLALSLTRGQVTPFSKDGVMKPCRFEDLAAELASLRRAYPDDTSLLLVPRPGATLAELVLAAVTSSRAPDGGPLYTGLALAPAGTPLPSVQDLAPRLRLLGPASVTTSPEVGRALPRRLLRCYHAALAATLEKKDAVPPEGKIEITARGKRLRLGGGIKDRALKSCVKEAVKGAMPAAKGRLTVTFSRGL